MRKRDMVMLPVICIAGTFCVMFGLTMIGLLIKNTLTGNLNIVGFIIIALLSASILISGTYTVFKTISEYDKKKKNK